MPPPRPRPPISRDLPVILDRFVPDFRGHILVPDNNSPNSREAAEARVKDPLWFLARQWETGEFESENGGRPVHFDVEWETSVVDHMSLGGTRTALDPDTPLESAVEQEGADGSSPAWDSARLEYRFGLEAGAWNLEAGEYEGRNLDWYHFNATPSSRRPRATTGRARVVPTTLYVERMPHPRWWRFEEAGQASIDPALDPEPNVLSMLLNEYLYLDANNWFLVPLEHPVGHLRRLRSTRAADTFGVTTDIAPIGAREGGDDWGLFRIDGLGSVEEAGEFLFLPNVGGSVVEGDLLEEVRLIRDEEANLVWGVEESYLDPSTGERVTRADETRPPAPAPITPVPDLAGAPRYRLATALAPNWIPYLPALLRPGDAASAQIGLRRGRTDPLATGDRRQYRGRLLAESWRLNEEEIPRVGLRVQRRWRGAVDCTGEVRFWVGRRKDSGLREASAGLEFDRLEEP